MPGRNAVRSALVQSEEKQYAAVLRGKGIGPDWIRKYGFAFEGKRVLIGYHLTGEYQETTVVSQNQYSVR